ncbi:hemerythrin domain-containing protein [Aminipila butyrica]|uniref:Hemerythrin domain-containing protein n=1 Tax=Aminipila butyrica TaxID=433296 RepID=A0A858BVB6_9FIRM|nr:hemerythrin domain-containing protein [Aminipila butyrica]QIB69537.1 hemerythrin domain-containing protein [Aminipila butyrica]
MSDMSNLKRQHVEMLEVLGQIRGLKEKNLEDTAQDLSFNINSLAGKLKMHLLSEDQFLYPKLMKSEDTAVKGTSQKFFQEMGGLAEVFQDFVQKYNIPFKILQNKEQFLKESEQVFKAVEDRIQREDKNLYPLAEK